MSTRQQDGGPTNPAKRLQPRPGASTTGKSPASASPDGGTTRAVPPARPSLTRPSSSSVAAVVTKPAEEANDLLSRLRRALNGIRAEVTKVTWPTRDELRNLTIVVIGISAGVGVVLGLLDVILGELIRFLTTGTVG